MALLHICLCFIAFFFTVATTRADLINGRFPYYILEELSANTRIGNVAIDAQLSEKYDTATFKELTFSFLNQGTDGDLSYLFQINPDTSIISPTVSIDRDAVCQGVVNCYVPLDVAVGPSQYFEIIEIIIEIIDINDHDPTFDQEEYILTISESAPIGTSLALPLASDLDSLSNAVTMYELVPENTVFNLVIDQDDEGHIIDLQLVTLTELDHEHTDIYQLRLVAQDGGHPSRSGDTLLNVLILDSNDNSPEFESRRYEVFVSETVEVNTVIAKVTAHDNDNGVYGLVRYSFAANTQMQYNDVFEIDSATGEIYVKQSMDFESQMKYELDIIARDQSSSFEDTATVTIRIMDVNDWRPHITVHSLNPEGKVLISEAARIGTYVTSVSVIDQDGGANGQVRCGVNDPTFILEKTQEGQFKLKLNLSLNREYRARYNLEIECSDMGEPPHTTYAMVQIEVIDANDGAPKFDSSFYQMSMRENNSIGEEFLTVHASDSDTGHNAQVIYNVETNYDNLVAIDINTGVLSAKTAFDRETLGDELTFRVFASDMGSPSRTGTATVLLILEDINDSLPQFTAQNFAAGIFENEAPGSLVGKVTAVDQDAEPNNVFHYEINTKQRNVPFDVDTQSGDIITTARLDRERQSVYYFTVLAIADIGQRYTASTSVTVYVADRNDQTPLFTWPTQRHNTIQIPPDTPLDTVIGYLQAEDADIGDNAKLEFELIPGHNSEYFEVSYATGAIIVAKDLSDIDAQTVSLRVQVQDWGDTPISSTAILYIVLNQTLLTNTDNIDIQTDTRVNSDEARVIILNNNKIIIVALTSVGLLLLFAIILAIILIKRVLSDRSHDAVSMCGSDRPLPVSRTENVFDACA